ncbi:rCG40272, isoform CRA_d [Rattus norvegicus]|uniref:RCG40272, isoform CRA_d n=1 Tax=Rattus norvegicus TaxID=10116 RepID=A6I6T4_RAT|nr:rCG40272, isoform CRA_d [Rattus norvegicus]
MYFPTAMTWYAGTTSSSVATMTRRSGFGTAGAHTASRSSLYRAGLPP